MANHQPDKGGRTEELLRAYFLAGGYFAVRGVPLHFGDTEVTDIDVWLYLRPSPLGRERVNVDAKDKSKPKALERILWAKGMQSALGLERAAIVTTDKRPLVLEFGTQHDVLVFDGNFLARLTQEAGSSNGNRLSEEEFVAIISGDPEDRLLGHWKSRLGLSKGRLLTALGFGGCNAWLEDVKYFAEQVIDSSRRTAACRLLYLSIAFFLVGLDYSLRRLAFEPPDARRRTLEDGFRYGSEGKASMERSLMRTTRLIESYAPEAKSLGYRVRTAVETDLKRIPVEMLGEYFARTENQDLFSLAREFEAHGFERAVLRPGDLGIQLKSLIGVMLDFFAIDRSQFFDACSRA